MAEVIDTRTDPESGREFYVYDDEGEQWKDSGQWKKSAPKYRITTSERGREVVARRYERAQQAAIDTLDESALDAIAAGKIKLKNVSDTVGWRAVIRKMGDLLFDTKSARGAEGAAAFLGKSTGYLAPEETKPEDIAMAIAYLFLPFLERLAKPEPERVKGKVIDASFRDT